MQGNVNNHRITENKVNANLFQIIEHPGSHTYWTAQNNSETQILQSKLKANKN